MVVAMVVDALLGWPDRLFARIGHPVIWLGRTFTASLDGIGTGPRTRRSNAALPVARPH